MSGDSLFLRYALEYAMILPGAAICLIPVWDRFRFDKRRGGVLIAGFLLTLIFFGAALSARLRFPTNSVLIPFSLFVLPAYCFAVDLPKRKLLFVFFTGTMLLAWATLMANYLFAARELSDPTAPFQVRSSLFCLWLSGLELILFGGILRRKLPELFRSIYLDALWRWFFLLPLTATAYFFWCVPRNLSNVMVGRIRPLSLLTWTVLLLLIYAFYQFFWLIVAQMGREIRLEQENRMLRIEEQRYRQLQETMRESRKQRHDFRQHLRLIAELCAADRFDELKRYLGDYVGSVAADPLKRCSNPAVDALASYYHHEARRQAAEILWRFDLPAGLPFSEIDFCIIFGNLIENAINAVAKLPPDRRSIQVSAGSIGSGMIGLSVSNPVNGAVPEANISPRPDGGESGIGLISVESTVERLGGTMTVEANGETFSVFILFNLPGAAPDRA